MSGFHVGRRKIENVAKLRTPDFLVPLTGFADFEWADICVLYCAQVVFRQSATPCNTQWLWCSLVAKSASKTWPTPIAFFRA